MLVAGPMAFGLTLAFGLADSPQARWADKWDDNSRNKGIGVNLAEMETGRFHVQMGSLKTIKASDLAE